ncbi:hypothetical protein ABTI71_19655, partial [Acinetobacter baumannii]
RISGIPAGATLAKPVNGTVTVTFGSMSLTPEQLAGLKITPPLNSDVDFDQSGRASATDGAGVEARRREWVRVPVDPG